MIDRLASSTRTVRQKHGKRAVTVEPLADWELAEIRQAEAIKAQREHGPRRNSPKRPRRAILATSQMMIRVAQEKLGFWA